MAGSEEKKSGMKLQPPAPPPGTLNDYRIDFPTPQIMLVTLTRPRQMNSITHPLAWQLNAVFDWFDAEPSLRVAIITGEGKKAFCAGSDLLEIERAQKQKVADPATYKAWEHAHPPGGFGGLSRRRSKKPIIAAVNGLALGGGFEIVLNCAITIAVPHAQFSLPEPTVGVYAYGGGLPRLVHTTGMPMASDIALTGRRVSAQEALQLRLITAISSTSETLLDEALAKAKQIASISPDGIIVTHAALREAWETGNIERAFGAVHQRYYERLMETDNSKEGLAAFREKRRPDWTRSKL